MECFCSSLEAVMQLMGCVLVSKCYLERGGIRVYPCWMELVMKCSCAEAFCSAPHLCDETQGNAGLRKTFSQCELAFSACREREGFYQQSFHGACCVLFRCQGTAERAVFLFLVEGSSFQIVKVSCENCKLLVGVLKKFFKL